MSKKQSTVRPIFLIETCINSLYRLLYMFVCIKQFCLAQRPSLLGELFSLDLPKTHFPSGENASAPFESFSSRTFFIIGTLQIASVNFLLNRYPTNCIGKLLIESVHFKLHQYPMYGNKLHLVSYKLQLYTSNCNITPRITIRIQIACVLKKICLL